MSDQIVTCPNCSENIPLTDVLTNQITQKIRNKFENEKKELERSLKDKKDSLISKENEILKREESIEKQVREKIIKERENLKKSIKEDAKKEFSLEINELNEKLGERDKKLDELQETELKARRLERELKEKDERFESSLESKINESKNKIKDELKKQYEDKSKEEIKNIELEMKRELDENNKKFIKAREDLRNEKNKKQELELVVAQKDDAIITEKIKLEQEFITKKEDFRKDIIKELNNANQEEIQRKIKVIEDLRKEINNLRTRAEQGSQQIQGEVSEDLLKQVLRENFPQDLIEDVPIGRQGADLTQTIRDSQGNECGIILWESKNTKTWQNSWIEKLKSDQKKDNAKFAILVSKTLPRGLSHSGNIQNIYVISVDLVVFLAQILRDRVIESHLKEQSLEGTNLKMERLYNYLNSSSFKQRILDSLECFVSMREELEKEITSTTKRWEKRRAIIQRVQDNIISMQGKFEGIASHSITELEEYASDLLESGGNDSGIQDHEEARNDDLMTDNDNDIIIAGDTIDLDCMGVEFTITISSDNEHDLSKGIFNQHHVNATSLLGKHVGQRVRIELPDGIFDGAEIINITR